jgi:NitT/TauT family transport system substrate-binding protein
MCLPLTIADRLGYFSAEGLEVELLDLGGGLRSLQAVQDNLADIVAGAFEHTIGLQSKGQQFRAFVLLGRSPQVSFGVSTRSMPSFKTVAELKGRRIGVAPVGSSSATVADLVLLRNGMRRQDVQFVELANAAASVAAVRAGQVDAISHYEPVMTMLEHRGDVRVIVDTRSLRGALDLYGGPVAGPCLFARSEYVQSSPRTIQAMANGVVHALKWLQTAGPSDIIKVVPEAYLLGDRGLYLSSINNVREAISVDGLIPEEGVRTALRTVGHLDSSVIVERIDLAKTYTNEFARKAKDKFRA